MLPRRWLSVALMIGLLCATTGGALAQDGGPVDPQVGEAVTALAGTAFTYQGQLTNGGSPVNGTCDFQFGVYDSAILGLQFGSTQTVTGVAVADGRFTVTLNSAAQFGARTFSGSARYLAIAVRCPAGSGSYTSLTPRQALTAAPLAFALPGLHTEQNATSPNIIGGYVANTVADGVYGATISGGGASGWPNSVTANYGTVGGGDGNTASGMFTTVSGGEENLASGTYATISGGLGNTTGFHRATVSGGSDNTASGYASTIGGGRDNTASLDASTVGGGGFNTASGFYGTVSGGQYNTASGFYSTVPGGRYNTASGDYSFAAGHNARALHIGAFVWSSEVNVPISSTVDNQFLVRATGGISLTTNTAGTTGCRLSAGGGTWTCTSDRNAKANFAAVDNVAVLDALMAIPIQTWNFNTQDAGIQHMGPMAQDFYAAYGLGEGELTISTVDADGVALAAIQGLYTVVQEKDAAIVALQESNAALQARVAALESAPAVQTSNLPAPNPLSAALPWLLLAGLVLLNLGGLAGYALAKRAGKHA